MDSDRRVVPSRLAQQTSQTHMFEIEMEDPDKDCLPPQPLIRS